jgi:hypothetical protein
MKPNTKLIFNRQIALQLSRLGFPIIDIIESRHKRYIDVYIFENTHEFQKSFTNLVSSRGAA